jgi:dolichol-phosphate mannosyltransferase
MKSDSLAAPLSLFSLVIPARDEAENLPTTIRNLSGELRRNAVPHEILVVDDGSTDDTWRVLRELAAEIPELRPLQSTSENGYGRAVVFGLRQMRGDCAAVMMADDSDDAKDAVRYWQLLNEGWDCVFGSRFVPGSTVSDYPWFKLILNRVANLFIRIIFNISLNDTTNAFKAYRRSTLEGCEPLIAPHFNLTVEIPLKAIVRGYSWTVVPISWRNRRFGAAKLKIKEMGSRYFFICAYVWLEKYFSRGDYRRQKKPGESLPRTPSPGPAGRQSGN